uniref:Uncharacterized protein n=1 Tax=viral metagenome TaxID=1070528 RepID=A0A6M3K850_9ZZZZ
MAARVNPAWILEMRKTADDRKEIDATLSFNAAAQELIKILVLRDIPFKIYNLGAGVKRITTDTDVCPCCKRKL